jgi:hypothetical protein
VFALVPRLSLARSLRNPLLALLEGSFRLRPYLGEGGVRDRLVCSKCGSREIDMVVTGTERR